MKILALVVLALLVSLVAGSAFGFDLGCADDDCDRGAPCREACAACNCNPVMPAEAGVVALGSARSLGALPQRVQCVPLAGVSRAVLHVPLSA